MAPMTAAAHGATKAHGAVIATRPASMPLTIMPGIGLSGLEHHVVHRHRRADGAGDRGVRRDRGELHVGDGEGRCGVEAEPAEQQDEAAELSHRDVVRRYRPSACRRARTCRCVVPARSLRPARRLHRRRARRRSRRSRRTPHRGSSCPTLLASQPPPHVHAANSG